MRHFCAHLVTFALLGDLNQQATRLGSGRYRPNEGHEAPTTRSSPAPLLGASLDVEAVPVEVPVVETGIQETEDPLEQASNPVDLLPLRQRPNKVPIARRNRVHGGHLGGDVAVQRGRIQDALNFGATTWTGRRRGNLCGLAMVSGSSVNGKG